MNNKSNMLDTSDYSILVVDDNRINIQVISQALRPLGTTVLKASNGQQALDILKDHSPIMILLDIMMPGIDGYEVCRRVKEIPRFKDIPIIFLTANVDSENILFAFEAGIVDYIAKPFNPSELLARVKTHLDLTLSKEKLKQLNSELIAVNNEKNEFLGMVSHDLKNPVYNIQMLAKVLKEDKGINEEDREEFLGDILFSTKKMLSLIQNLLDINKIEQGNYTPELKSINLVPIAERVVEDYKERANEKNINIYFNNNLSRGLVYADESALEQVFDNLISNAVKYSGHNESVFVSVSNGNDNSIQVEVKDHGPGLKDDEKEKVFGKFVKLSNKPTGGESSNGLGLSITKRYVEKMNGKIWLETEEGKGTSFFVSLPKS
jgi:signal transduction histidine kinase